MANRIRHKRSAVQGKVPTTANLELGEIGLNTFDGKAYMKKDDGTESIVQVGDGANAGELDGLSSSQFIRSDVDDTASGKLTLDGGTEHRYNSEIWQHGEGYYRPVSRLLYSDVNVGTVGTVFPDVYGEADLSAIDADALFTYDQAWAAVESHGGRLPTLAEILGRAGTGSGQGYDNQLLWTCTPAGPHHVWVAYGNPSLGNPQIVDITDPTALYRTRCFFDVSRNNRIVTYSSDGQLRSGNNLVWHTGNDGAGSGLDADLLDGQQASYYAPIDSPALTGTPTAPTATAGTNNTQLATTAFVNTAVAGLVDSAPATLDTLNELAAALGDDPNFATTVTNSLAGKLGATTQFGGDVSGTYNAIVVANDSHTHDGRYYTEAESDARYLGIGAKAADANLLDGLDSSAFLRSNVADSASGALTFSGGLTITNGPGNIAGSIFSNGWLKVGTSSSGWAFDQNEIVTFGQCLIQSATGSTLTFTNAPVFSAGGGDEPSAPFIVESTTLVIDLNADLLDGQQGSYYQNASNLTSGTLPDARLGYQELGRSPVGNFGQWEGHGTFNDFNTPPNYWGWTYVNGTTNAPNANSLQWYRGRFSLGNAYGLGSDVSDYWMELAVPRYSQGGLPGNMWIRTCENGAEQSWHQVAATVSGNTTWHAGNDGSGSGLDADLLDGLNSTSFIRSDANSSFSGILTGGNIDVGTLTYDSIVGPNTSSRYKLRVYSSGDYAIGMEAGVTFGGLNDWAMTFQFNNEDDRGFWWGDGAHTSAQGAMALTTNGRLTVARSLRLGYGESDTVDTPNQTLDVSGDASFSGKTLVGTTTPITGLFGASVNHGATLNVATTALEFSGVFCSYRNDSTYNAISIAKSKTATPSGHGLIGPGEYVSAISFDGSDGTQFINAGQIRVGVEGTPAVGVMPTFMEFMTNSGSGIAPTARFSITSAGALYAGTVGSNLIWHAGSDGSGSGLDADLLDGQQGSYYQNASNINAGTLSSARLLSPVSGNWHRGVPLIGGDGVMEVGRYIDFHTSNTGTSDYDVRLSAEGSGDLRLNGGSVWYSSNDGAGSGLDADLLDGLNSTSFLRTDATTTFNASGNDFVFEYDANRTLIRIQRLGSERMRLSAAGDAIDVGLYNSATLNLPSSTTFGLSTNWHGGNDGAGSGLDADLLDGVHASSFIQNTVNTWHTSSDGRQRLYFGNTSHTYIKSSDNIYFRTENSDTNNCYIASGSLTAVNVNSTSDRRLKDNIETLSDPLQKVLSLRGVEYTRNDIKGNPRQIGLIAQEAEEVVPEVVSESEEGIKNIAYGNLVGLLVEAIKEQQLQIEALQAEVQRLKAN